MFGKPKLAPAFLCILTFCVVTVVVGDAVIPFGFLLVNSITDYAEPIVLKVILLAPVVGLLAASFFTNRRTRGMLTAVCSLCLVALWLMGLVLYVVQPPYPIEFPRSAKMVCAVTSVPFVVAAIVTIIYSMRNVFCEGNQAKPDVDKESANPTELFV
jgi:hypothetical protein